MITLHEQDYPEWLTKFITYCGKKTNLFELEQRIWEIARESEEIPNIGTITIDVIFEETKRLLEEELKEEIPLELYNNNLATSFTLYHESVRCIEDILKILESHVKR